MTLQEAQQNIGKPFKHAELKTKFDIIESIDEDGTIHGEFLEAHCEACRLKGEQPPQLIKKNNENQKQ